MGWKGASFGLLVPLRGIAAPKTLWTRKQAGALPAEAVRCKLSVGQGVEMEIPVIMPIRDSITRAAL